MDVERRHQHMHWIKHFNFKKQNLLHLLHISSMLKMCLSSSFIMSSSLAKLSAAFSVLLAAITHFTLAFLQRNKHSQGVTFVGQFWVWLGKFLLGSKLISGGGGLQFECPGVHFLKK